MTIASEITRLQNDKAAICTAIENKGVTVGSVKLDDYAACIDAISSGGGKSVTYLLIGGGGGGGGATCVSGNKCGPGGGGGAGGVRAGDFVVHGDSLCVVVGAAGSGGGASARGCNGGNSCIKDNCTSCYKLVYGGGGGGTYNSNSGQGNSGGSGGGAAFSYYSQGNYVCGGASWGCAGEMGTYGGDYLGQVGDYANGVAGGGGGATSSGSPNGYFYCMNAGCQTAPGWGGKGLQTTRGGKTVCYAGGGGGGTDCCCTCNRGCGRSGGGNGGTNTSTSGCVNGKAATTCGSGGGGGGYRTSTCRGTGGAGAKGLVIIGYNCECKDCNGFTCATGGNSCYVCNGMKYHCFTSSGTFCIVC